MDRDFITEKGSSILSSVCYFCAISMRHQIIESQDAFPLREYSCDSRIRCIHVMSRKGAHNVDIEKVDF